MKFRYVPELDGLRGLAILAVMGFHFAGPTSPHNIVTGGSLGVDVFFVLSGFLITSILSAEIDQTGRLDYRAFIMRRVRRLVPALVALLAAYAIIAPILFPTKASERWFDIGLAMFYVTNLHSTFRPHDLFPLIHTWSLSMEEQFYLLWPFALLPLAKLPPRRAISWLVVIWVIVTTLRTELALFGLQSSAYASPLHSTGLIVGAAIALRPPKVRIGLLGLAALSLLFLFGADRTTFLIPIPLAEIATALVIADAPRILAAPPMLFLGRISYGTYLWHFPINVALNNKLVAAFGFLPAMISLVALSLIAGWLSSVLIEQWFLRRRTVRHSAPISGYAADPN